MTAVILTKDQVDAMLKGLPGDHLLRDEGDKPDAIDVTQQALDAIFSDDEETGMKHDDGKLRYDLIPPEIITALAAIFTYGAGKYAPRNCERGFSYGRLYAALWRHMIPFWEGRSIDPESGMSHLNHALFNVGMLLVQEKRRTGTDDRPKEVR